MNTFKCKSKFINIIEFLTLCCTPLFFKIISAMKCNSPNLEEKKKQNLGIFKSFVLRMCYGILDNSKQIQLWNISSRNILFLHMCSIFSRKVYVAL